MLGSCILGYLIMFLMVKLAIRNIYPLMPVPLNLNNKGICTIIASGLLSDEKCPLTALL